MKTPRLAFLLLLVASGAAAAATPSGSRSDPPETSTLTCDPQKHTPGRVHDKAEGADLEALIRAHRPFGWSPQPPGAAPVTAQPAVSPADGKS